MSAAENKALVERFYAAFQTGDAETMAACYSDNATFNDEVFDLKNGAETGGMWRMLCGSSSGLVITFSNINATEKGASAHWEAVYDFSQTGRKVHNKIDATFTFDEDGKILTHVDVFNFWKWSKMALGTPGYLLGWTPFLQKKVRTQAGAKLQRFLQK